MSEEAFALGTDQNGDSNLENIKKSQMNVTSLVKLSLLNRYNRYSYPYEKAQRRKALQLHIMQFYVLCSKCFECTHKTTPGRKIV